MKALDALPFAVCKHCHLPLLQADSDRNGAGRCRCLVTREKPYLVEHAGADDGPSVGWAPAPSKDTEFRADGQGGVVLYRRSKTTRRMVPGRRIAPWTERA